MGQFGFFDAERRLAAIYAKGDPLEMIARVVPLRCESVKANLLIVLTTCRIATNSSGAVPPRNYLTVQKRCALDGEIGHSAIRIAATVTAHL